MSTIDQIAISIIREQELIIGPVAWREAHKVSGLNISDHTQVIISDVDGKSVIDKLVGQYERLFGRASREVCREAAAPLLVTLSPAEIPSSLM
jgi:hypothetical protein